MVNLHTLESLIDYRNRYTQRSRINSVELAQRMLANKFPIPISTGFVFDHRRNRDNCLFEMLQKNGPFLVIGEFQNRPTENSRKHYAIIAVSYDESLIAGEY